MEFIDTKGYNIDRKEVTVEVTGRDSGGTIVLRGPNLESMGEGTYSIRGRAIRLETLPKLFRDHQILGEGLVSLLSKKYGLSQFNLANGTSN